MFYDFNSNSQDTSFKKKNSFLSGTIVILINYCFYFIVYYIVEKELHSTNTNLKTNLAYKLFMTTSFNTIIIPLIVFLINVYHNLKDDPNPTKEDYSVII